MTPTFIEFKPAFPRKLWTSEKSCHDIYNYEHALEIAKSIGPLRESSRIWLPHVVAQHEVIRQITYNKPSPILVEDKPTKGKK